MNKMVLIKRELDLVEIKIKPYMIVAMRTLKNIL